MRKHNAWRGTGVCTLAALMFGAGAAAVPLSGNAEALASNTREFSDEEQSALREGKLVTRPSEVVRGRARLIGGLAWQVVRASPRRVWQTLQDVRSYPHFLPAVDEARVVDQQSTGQRLFVRHRLGFISASYFVLIAADARDARLRFRLDRSRPASIQDAFGEISVSSYAGRDSVVSLAILADVGDGLLAGAVRGNIHEWMLRVPSELKRFVESSAEPASLPN